MLPFLSFWELKHILLICIYLLKLVSFKENIDNWTGPLPFYVVKSSSFHCTGLQKRLLLMSNETISSHKPRIGFTALTSSHQWHMGIGQAVQFPKIVTNNGNGFDQNTGIFRAPVSGLYLFSASVVSLPGMELRCALVHNGNAVASIFAGDGTTNSSGSKSILIELSPNDDVWVRVIMLMDLIFLHLWE